MRRENDHYNFTKNEVKRQRSYLNASVLIILMLHFTFFGCASFNKRGFRNNLKKIPKNELHKISGIYEIKPIKWYSTSGKKRQNNILKDSISYIDGYSFISNKFYQKYNPLNYTYTNSYSLKIDLIDAKKLKVYLLEDSKVKLDTTFYGTYKKRMLYIDNKHLDCHGIPFIFGGCMNSKIRIGLTKERNLIINQAYSNEGALLLFIGAGNRYNLSYEYKRK